MMVVAGVRFRRTGRVYYFDPGELALRRGEWVIVETQRGAEAGEVVIGPKPMARAALAQDVRPVLRLATTSDLESRRTWEAREAEALRQAIERVQHHQLPMKLVDVEYAFDGSRATFYFTAEGRVDFRELVRDLSTLLHTRIELRQIGARDQARMVGGIGPCGMPTCCTRFLSEFHPVTIRVAKEQGLALNPEKLSGLCGRLMCCLNFEEDHPPAPNGRTAAVTTAATPRPTRGATTAPQSSEPPVMGAAGTAAACACACPAARMPPNGAPGATNGRPKSRRRRRRGGGRSGSSARAPRSGAPDGSGGPGSPA